MELIFTWVIQVEHTGALPENPSFALIKKEFKLDFIFLCTGTRQPVAQKVYFIPTSISIQGPALQWDDVYMGQLEITWLKTTSIGISSISIALLPITLFEINSPDIRSNRIIWLKSRFQDTSLQRLHSKLLHF